MAIQSPENLTADQQQLIAEGAGLDAASTPPPIDPATGQPEAPINFTDEARTLVDLIAGTVQAVWPFVEIADATRGRLAGAWAPVMEKYNMTGAGLFGQYSAEVGAAIVTVPVVMQVRAAILSHKKTDKPAAGTDTPNGEHLPL